MKKNILCITPISHLFGVEKELKKHGNISYEPNISLAKLIKLLNKKKYDALFVNPNKQGFILNENALKGSSIKVINTCSTGVNHIDLNYCKEKNIKIWSLTKDFDIIKDLPSTSELAFGLMITLLRKVIPAHNSVIEYKWDYLPFIGRQVKDLTVGVVGYGRLGKIFCKQLEGFGAKILISDPYVKNCRYPNKSLKALAPLVDVLVLHVHVSDTTRKFINKKMIALLKKGSIIINTSRGELVDENAIIVALKHKQLGGYATDVISHEFENIKESPLIKNIKKLPIIITPHIGGMTIEGQTKAYLHAVNKFKNLKKEILNVKI